MFGRRSSTAARKQSPAIMSQPSQTDSVDRESLVPGGRPASDLPLSPGIWKLLGVLYILTGLSEFAFAALWRFWVGIAVGLGVAKLGVSLWGLGATGGRPQQRPPAVGFKARTKAAFWSIVMWGSNKVQKLLYFFRYLIYAYGFLALLMLLIHVFSPDPDVSAFPAACPPGKGFGCSRIAESDPHHTRHLKPLHLNTTLGAASAAAADWVEQQAQSKILLRRDDLIHARFITFFWGFADDMFVGLRCNEQQQVVVEVQGQLRLGKSDLGVNGRRNQRFMLDLSNAAAAGQLEPGQCQQT